MLFSTIRATSLFHHPQSSASILFYHGYDRWVERGNELFKKKPRTTDISTVLLVS